MASLFSSPQIQVPYVIKKSSRAKRGRLVIKHDHVQVIVPKGGSEAQMLKFLSTKQKWAEKILADNRNNPVTDTPWPLRFEEDTQFLLFGNWVPVTVVLERGRKTTATLLSDKIRVAVKYADWHKPDLDARVEKAIAVAVKSFFEAEAWSLAEEMAPIIGEIPKTIRYKHLRSRWGSCSTARSINLNLHLIHMPFEVFQYVVVHELCHLKHPNHQPRYWALVEECWPRYKDQEAYIRKHGNKILSALTQN